MYKVYNFKSPFLKPKIRLFSSSKEAQDSINEFLAQSSLLAFAYFFKEQDQEIQVISNSNKNVN